MNSVRRGRIALLCLAVSCAVAAARGQTIVPLDYGAMRWRLIGPFRGGRAVAVAGVPSEPDVFYFGSVDGGVWKTGNAGRTWQPLWQHERVASIGAIAVAESNPSIIYAGTGEADIRSDISIGDGIYKSTDGGKTWKNVGLRATKRIGRVLIDPRNPDVVLVAALGSAYGPNQERGVFRSADGGKTWKKVLYENENTGAIDLGFDPVDPQTVYAALWNARRPPWSVYGPHEGPGSGIYKSTDEGLTWSKVSGQGLPTVQMGRIGLAVAAPDGGRIVYALIQAGKQSGLYRSDNAGATWRRTSSDPRITDRDWYFGHVTVDPNNANIVYVPDVALYWSRDGGKTFMPLKGAPGGDDYHSLWVDPADSRRMIVGCDQGTVISVDDGKTWSSWYNQPTAQLYHVVVDHQFPFRIYGAQQDSGTASVISRSDYGEISFRDWYSVGGGESGYIAPDPLDPNIVYGGDYYGGLTRFDQRTGQVQNIAPCPLQRSLTQSIASAECRFTWTSPLIFSPQDPHILYFGAQFLMQTANGGQSWKRISPDLTQSSSAPAGTGAQGRKAPARGVIYTIAPSPVEAGEIWVGTDNGLVQLTRDGGNTWQNVTPKGLPAWSKISLIEASRFGAGTAFAAVDRHRVDDDRPYIYRTDDYGKTWTDIANGITAPAYVHAVREDPARRGLLYAGTDTGVYVSFDNGGHWLPLQLSLPTSSIRDLAITDNDLVVATHGRSFWVLDDLTPLRQLDAHVTDSDVFLFKPETAMRIRRDVNQDTPLPAETPLGQNPPSGAIIDYLLKSAPSGPISLEISDADGKVIRKFVSGAPAPAFPKLLRFTYSWLRHPRPLTEHAGLNRFVWDLRYPSPPVLHPSHSIAAVVGQNTPTLPRGPLVLPGSYTVRLTVEGKSTTRELHVVMDPRVKATAQDLAEQLSLESRLSGELTRNYAAIAQIRGFESRLKAVEGRMPATAGGKQARASLEKIGQQAARILRGAKAPGGQEGLLQLDDDLATLETAADSADTRPTDQCERYSRRAMQSLDAQLALWQRLQSEDLPIVNHDLHTYGMKPIVMHGAIPHHVK
jgi:photosystem II stability/assembly factor-like uncharacterized protein